MIVSFMRMYRFIRDINNKLDGTNFNCVEINEKFFRDLEKVFDDIADMLSYPPMFESTKNENG